ncbi:MAG: energy-coupling factor transporter transmembrane protein EcfT [Mycobacterium sp.]|nr:energy-coupling factor transporter transmembrane protein EcfT [Mycobacterium sp.]
MTSAAPQKNPQSRPLVLLRPVPGTSPIHELWAGTKLIVVFAIGVLLTFYPGWVPIALVALLIAVAMRMARIPRSVLPSIPVFLWLLVLIGGITASFAGGAPFIDIGSVQLGLGGLGKFLRVTALSIVLLLLGGLVSWTTNVSEIAPAVATLGRPLRFLRLPIADWAVALALSLRAFPMLVDEFRLLYAARKLRPKPELRTRRQRRKYWAREIVDLLTAGIVVMLRRADEMGDAITARGGAGQIAAAPTRPKMADWVALSIVTVVCGAGLVLELTVAGTSGRG